MLLTWMKVCALQNICPSSSLTRSTHKHLPNSHGRFAVLGRFLYALNEFCREKYGMDHSISDFHVYEFAKVRKTACTYLATFNYLSCLHEPYFLAFQIWMCDQDKSNRIVHEFFQSQHFKDGIPVIPGGHS